MHEFESETGRMTEEEARELMRRLSASQQAQEEARSLPSTRDVAELLGTDELRVQRELEILRHEHRIAELEKQRQEEEQLLWRMRAEREATLDHQEDEEARREAWRQRQEQMERWVMRREPTLEEPTSTQPRTRANTMVYMVLAVLFLFFVFFFMSLTCTVQREVGATPPTGPTVETR